MAYSVVALFKTVLATNILFRSVLATTFIPKIVNWYVLHLVKIYCKLRSTLYTFCTVALISWIFRCSAPVYRCRYFIYLQIFCGSAALKLLGNVAAEPRNICRFYDFMILRCIAPKYLHINFCVTAVNN